MNFVEEIVVVAVDDDAMNVSQGDEAVHDEDLRRHSRRCCGAIELEQRLCDGDEANSNGDCVALILSRFRCKLNLHFLRPLRLSYLIRDSV